MIVSLISSHSTRGGRLGVSIAAAVWLALAALLTARLGRKKQCSSGRDGHDLPTGNQQELPGTHTPAQQTTHPVTSVPQGRRVSPRL